MMKGLNKFLFNLSVYLNYIVGLVLLTSVSIISYRMIFNNVVNLFTKFIIGFVYVDIIVSVVLIFYLFFISKKRDIRFKYLNDGLIYNLSILFISVIIIISNIFLLFDIVNISVLELYKIYSKYYYNYLGVMLYLIVNVIVIVNIIEIKEDEV